MSTDNIIAFNLKIFLELLHVKPGLKKKQTKCWEISEGDFLTGRYLNLFPIIQTAVEAHVQFRKYLLKFSSEER